MIKRFLKITAISIAAFIGFMLLYLAAAFGLSHIAVNKNAALGNDVAVYIITNGVHTDLALPINYKNTNWSTKVPFKNTLANDTLAQYLAFGWGDKGFYLQTPTWADLTFSVAFKAALGLGSSAIHATFYKTIKQNENCVQIMLSDSAYHELCTYIENSFELSSAGNFMAIKTQANYSQYDAFYEAKGSYSLVNTCNSWTNNALKAAGQKAALWTPFDSGIFNHYRIK